MRGGEARGPIPIREILLGKSQPVLAPRTKINVMKRALKGYTKSYDIGVKSDKDAL